MKESDDLRNELIEFLKKQEKESKEMRRDKNVFNSTLWELILPQHYDSIINILLEKGLLEKLRKEALINRTKVWDNVDDFCLERVINKVSNCFSIILEMSEERAKQFVNSVVCDIKKLFKEADFSQKVLLVKWFSARTLENFLVSSVTDLTTDENEVLKFLKEVCFPQNYREKNDIEIFKRISDMSQSMIARLFEEADAQIIYNIMEHMSEEKISKVYGELRKEKLFQILNATDFNLLMRTNVEFPIEKISEEERQVTFLRLKEKYPLLERFSMERWASFFCAVGSKEKKYILEVILRKIGDYDGLYEFLPHSERREMIEILVISQRSIAAHVLETEKKKGELGYFEALALKDLNSSI